MRPRSQCVGGMLLVQWCYKHVLNCLTCEASMVLVVEQSEAAIKALVDRVHSGLVNRALVARAGRQSDSPGSRGDVASQKLPVSLEQTAYVPPGPRQQLACVVRDANMGHQLAGGNSSWCPELESRTTHTDTAHHTYRSCQCKHSGARVRAGGARIETQTDLHACHRQQARVG